MNNKRLTDVAPIQAGTESVTDESVWMLNLDAVQSNSGKILEYIYVNPNDVGSSTVRFDTSNVLYSKLRPYLNKVVLPDRGGYATTELLPLKPNPNIITREYLTYFLRSDYFVSYISEKVAGAKMPRVSTNELKDSIIPIPTLEQQKYITTTLDKTTELIDLRKQQLEKLDQLVKSRFIEMFDVELDNSVVEMNDICSIITDGTHQPPKFTNQGIPFLLVSNIVDNEIIYDTNKYITREDYVILIRRTPLEVGDILLTTVGSYGNAAIVRTEQEFCFQRHIAYIKPKREIVNSVYLHAAFRSDTVQDQIEIKVKGIAQKTLNLSELKTIKVKLPPLDLQNQFAAFVQQVEKSKLTIQQSLDKLNILYKSLMQQYFG